MPLTVTSARFHKDIVILKFKEINSVNEAVELKNLYVKVDKSIISAYLEKDEFYIDDLVDLDVYDESENLIGEVDHVVNMNHEDLVVVKDLVGKEHLVPFVKELVPEIDLKNGRITVRKIPGLIETASDKAEEA